MWLETVNYSAVQQSESEFHLITTLLLKTIFLNVKPTSFEVFWMSASATVISQKAYLV